MNEVMIHGVFTITTIIIVYYLSQATRPLEVTHTQNLKPTINTDRYNRNTIKHNRQTEVNTDSYTLSLFLY